MRGMRTSIRIKSGLALGATCTASSPFDAATTSWPAKRRVNAIRSRMSRSSSAIRIFAILASSTRIVYRECKGEGTAFTGNAFAVHPDTAIVHLHQLMHDWQTQTRTGGRQHKRMFAAEE